MTCTVQDRARVREAAAELRALDAVIAADAHPPGEGTRPGWSLSVVMDHPLPADAMDRLAAHGLAVPDVSPQGTYFEALATA
jgi:hypothetical protein